MGGVVGLHFLGTALLPKTLHWLASPSLVCLVMYSSWGGAAIAAI